VRADDVKEPVGVGNVFAVKLKSLTFEAVVDERHHLASLDLAVLHRHELRRLRIVVDDKAGPRKTKSAADKPSLKAFLANFCVKTPAVPEQAAGSGAYRETMTQPGVYWVLDAPFIRIIGLYSNASKIPAFSRATAARIPHSLTGWRPR
jgi:hypothetical protein